MSNGDLPGIGDFDGDLKFTNADMQGFLAYLQAGNGSLSAVPEPASLALVGLSIPALRWLRGSENSISDLNVRQPTG